MTLPLALYGLATGLAEPLAPFILKRRAKVGREDPLRLDERLGRTRSPRPPGPLVWLHGVSVGETVSLLPLVEGLRARRPDLGLLVTSGTRASAELLGRRLPAGVRHQYVPVDTPGAVRRFLNHWRPDLGVFAESELWPNLILTARRRGTRLVLASARITEGTARTWRRAPASARRLLSAFDLITIPLFILMGYLASAGGIRRSVQLGSSTTRVMTSPRALRRKAAGISRKDDCVLK